MQSCGRTLFSSVKTRWGHHGVAAQLGLGLQAGAAAVLQLRNLGSPVGIGPALGELGRQRLGKLLGDGPGVAYDAHGQGVVAAHLEGVNVHLDNLCLRVDDAVVPAGAALVDAGAQGQDDIGPVHGLQGLGGTPAARGSHVQPVAVGEGVVVAVGGHHRHIQPLGQGHGIIGGLGVHDAAAGQNQRPLGPRQQSRRLGHGLGIAGGAVGHGPVGGRETPLPSQWSCRQSGRGEYPAARGPSSRTWRYGRRSAASRGCARPGSPAGKAG